MSGSFLTLVAPTLALTLLAAVPAQDSPRIHTDRPAGRQLLKLPKEEDAFGFVVYGDRTGGVPEGIEVLRQAVVDTNLLDPDLVFTVGDLVQGYNATAEWMAQAEEYKSSMAKLRMPWFPVAGNHDVYWRGPNKPEGEHDRNFEAQFGPLWYAVQHKQCWFIALYTDEGNPETGEKNFNKPECQRMSPAQFAWLEKTLQQAKDARHVFVFMHHPRWLAQYGDDWDRVHDLLARAGNVTAVFAGHIHRMRYDGVRDGIEYYTLAAVGAHLAMDAPEGGYLNQFHVVTVRPEGIVVACLPVGTVMDPKEITGQVSDDVAWLEANLRPTVECAPAGDGAAVRADGAVDAIATLAFENGTSRPIELEIVPTADPRWRFGPDHQHLLVPAGKTASTTFALQRGPGLGGDAPFTLPRLEVRCDYLAAGRRIGVPSRQLDLELPPPSDLGRRARQAEGVLSLDGRNSCLAVPSAELQLPDGPLTLELWLRGDTYGGRRAVLAKTQGSEFALFCSGGVPEFSVHLDGAYASAKADETLLVPGQWHHVAGVFDGAEVRCYVDGRLVARRAAEGSRTRNDLPLFVGADPDGRGQPVSFFAGKIDEVRISKIARYRGDSFEPAATHDPDANTVLLLHLDGDFGPWTADASGLGTHPRRRGAAICTVESRPQLR
ncbi:MAG: metallophosphoesterase [Planctomycetes bacterium]|nr:metallophosphoesterase [Planctomycetota bacterium]